MSSFTSNVGRVADLEPRLSACSNLFWSNGSTRSERLLVDDLQLHRTYYTANPSGRHDRCRGGWLCGTRLQCSLACRSYMEKSMAAQYHHITYHYIAMGWGDNPQLPFCTAAGGAAAHDPRTGLATRRGIRRRAHQFWMWPATRG